MGTDSIGRSAPAVLVAPIAPVDTRRHSLSSESRSTPPGATIDASEPISTVVEAPSEGQARLDASKRAIELVVSIAGLIVLAPLLVVLAVVVAITTGASPIFVQERIGRDGKTFPCLKFRTMYASASERLEAVLAADPLLRSEWEADHKLRRDPRITPFGRVLRTSNLDELPQLLNVVLGQMSLVGPRPIVFAEVPKYGSALGTVLTVRPGLTGLWQVSGRNNLPYAERVALDERYVAERTGRTDLAICVSTARQMVGTALGRSDNGAR